MSQFKSQAEPRGVSLPGDMWLYVRDRAERDGRSVSNYLQRLIEEDAMDCAQARVLVDSPETYNAQAGE